MRNSNATIGNWYRDSEGDAFELVAFDESEDCFEIQYYDGAVEEFDRETWNSMDLQSVSQPEDWAGAYDNLCAEDYGDFESSQSEQRWRGELE
ncbi:MAG: hypothetical protein GXP10_05130 [Gammaproteobacteria bacterium]|nr:hypothetical protein [Gammaproteobacteria bacterium]